MGQFSTGANTQTLTLALRNHLAQFTCIDISPESLAEAQRRTSDAGLRTVKFELADIFALSCEPETFDHTFVCFVLEHLTRPVEALELITRMVKPGGTVTVVEDDHGSAYFHPDSTAARSAIACQVELQRVAGGNALIGRQVYPLMVAAGLEWVEVSPRVNLDSRRPTLVEGFTKNTFIAMIEGIRDSAIAAELSSPRDFDEGIQALHRTTVPDGIVCYSFFKGVSKKPK